jgi:NOL1/NOP2/fmu family ribosome biogenesis protein
LHFWQEDGKVFASTSFAMEFFRQIKNLKFLKTGVHIATANKKKWTPGYDMVYSLQIHWNLPLKNVELNEALQILHGESHQWVAEAAFYFVVYQRQKIALIKQIGQRFNNLHPNEWRIRHLPK